MAETLVISQQKKTGWKVTWSNSLQKSQIIMGTSIMIVISLLLPSFFNSIQKRNGTLLNDWLLDRIPVHDVSVYVFILIWGMVGLLIYRMVQTPYIYIKYIWLLTFICLARIISITLVPLLPPVGIIPLTDPLTGLFYGKSTITKDLFFSGHTSTMLQILFCLEKRTDKIIAFFALLAVMALLLVQHVHYTIDVIAAPFIVYPFYRLVKVLVKQ